MSGLSGDLLMLNVYFSKAMCSLNYIPLNCYIDINRKLVLVFRPLFCFYIVNWITMGLFCYCVEV